MSSFRSGWSCSSRKGPHALYPSVQGFPRNSIKGWSLPHLGGCNVDHFLSPPLTPCGGQGRELRAVHVRTVPPASPLFGLARLQTCWDAAVLASLSGVFASLSGVLASLWCACQSPYQSFCCLCLSIWCAYQSIWF